MAKEFAKKFYASERWKKCRNSYISERTSIDGGLCEICHSDLGFIIHHKTVLTPVNINDPDVTLGHDNLQYVCKRCHDELEGHGVVRKKKLLVFFDENGNPAGKTDEYSPPIQGQYDGKPRTGGED